MVVAIVELTRENYRSPEADQEYMSVSQYKDFLSCEAMAMAKLRGEYVPAPDKNLLVGSYIHAWNEGTLEEFKQENPEMFSTRGASKGKLKSDFLFADLMISTLEQDKFCMYALAGQKEVIMTSELFGAPWKIRMDVYNPEGDRRIVDLKSTRSIYELVWSKERWAKVSFVDAYNYPLQLAVYCEIERINCDSDTWAEPLIVAVSKEDPPDKAIISLNDPYRFKNELSQVEQNMPHILQVKVGLVSPQRCEKCVYCRGTKQLDKVIHYSDIGVA